MTTILIQVLTLLSALLINFMVPLVYGLKEYGLFIKANIIIFLFHKFTDIASEPLLSTTDPDMIFPTSFLLNTFLLLIFEVTKTIFPMGNTILLSTMLFSNTVLLTMYSRLLHKWVVSYLLIFDVFFVTLLLFQKMGLYSLNITQFMLASNVIPSSLFVILMIWKNKIPIMFTSKYEHVVEIASKIPELFSLNLVNNLFSSALPVYFSYVFSAETLGLLKVQLSIIQSGTSIFPINTKMITTYLVNANEKIVLFQKFLFISLSYFTVFSFLGISLSYYHIISPTYSHAFLLIPIAHMTIMIERYMLSLKKRRSLMGVNLIVTTLCITGLLYFKTHLDILFLYAFTLCVYSLLLLTQIFVPMRAKLPILLLSVITPLSLFLSQPSILFIMMILIAGIFISQISIYSNRNKIMIIKDNV